MLPITPVRSFAAAVAPLASLLGPTTHDVSAALPPLSRIAASIGRVTNATAFVPGHGDAGYLYWLAWFAHNVDSVFSTGDALGAVARGLALVSCSSGSQSQLSGLLDKILGLPSSCQAGP